MAQLLSAGEQLVQLLNRALPDGSEWDERESALLDLASHQANDIERLEQLLAEQGAAVPGSKGQPRLSGVFAELRQQRLALARLLSDLRMPDEVGAAQTGASIRKSRAARARWDRADRSTAARAAQASA